MDLNGRRKPSIDGFRRVVNVPQRSHSLPQPDYRPDHELPAPKPTPLIREHEPEVTPPQKAPTPLSVAPEPDHEKQNGTKLPKKRGWKKWLLATVAVLIVAAIVAGITAYAWYQQQLTPVSTDTTQRIKVIIPTGATPSKIADLLRSAGVIRSRLAFSVYTKLSGTEKNMKAGAYSIQPSISTPAIVEHLVQGKSDTFSVKFLPGGTLMSTRKALIESGFSEQEVDAAFNKTYNRPLFDTKPAGTTLEGYLYGETIEFDVSATVETILNRFFDEYEGAITDNNLVAGFQKQGLTLYQGITLASIVQSEISSPDANTPSNDQRQVARVFLNRMADGMTLGSDVTAYYGAAKIGAAHSVSVDTPYNTRIHTGLPPGPISTPSLGALLAVANPADNNYLFFLAGDDNVMHYATTDAGHQHNIQQYCQQKCASN